MSHPGAARASGYRRVTLALCLSGALGSALWCAAGAPPAIPDTPAGRTFRVWLAAYNAADSVGLEAYARHFERTMSVRTQLAFREQTGPWSVVAVERSSPRRLDVVLRTSADAAHRHNATITTYGIVDVADSSAADAKTTLVLAGTGAAAPIRRIDAAQRSAAIDSVAAKVLRSYALPDVAKPMADSLLARRARGAYDDEGNEIGFAHRMNDELLHLSGDKQLNVEYAWRLPMPVPIPAPLAMRWPCGFEPPRMLDGGVAYVAYVAFHDFHDPGMDCGHEVSDAMNAVAAARALIVDLRENAGGSPTMMAYLASYLVAGCTQLDDSRGRDAAWVESRWTLDGLPGPSFGGTKPLVILTSGRTFSEAEELAYVLKARGRATIVGERTAGGAKRTALGRVGAHLLVRVPVARVVEPITGSSWQGAGVEPDVDVPASEALATAQRLIRQGRIEPPSPRAPAVRRVARLAATVAPLRGIHFSIDTLEPHEGSRGVLSRVAGVAQFANGRGRLDVTAVRKAAVVSLNGIVIGTPLAAPGDYYLFDHTGFILVRPVTRTFSGVRFTRADYNQTGALLPGAFLMKDAPLRAETVRAVDMARRTQHALESVHWHMQPPNGALYARGWLELEDAPAVEAGVARWFEVAAALATSAVGTGALAAGGLEVTSVVLLRRPDARGYQVRYMELLHPRGLTSVDIDPARLVVPAGYVETVWPGFERARGVRDPLPTTGARWRWLEDTTTQRLAATCRAPWLPAR